MEQYQYMASGPSTHKFQTSKGYRRNDRETSKKQVTLKPVAGSSYKNQPKSFLALILAMWLFLERFFTQIRVAYCRQRSIGWNTLVNLLISFLAKRMWLELTARAKLWSYSNHMKNFCIFPSIIQRVFSNSIPTVRTSTKLWMTWNTVKHALTLCNITHTLRKLIVYLWSHLGLYWNRLGLAQSIGSLHWNILHTSKRNWHILP